MYKRTFCRVIVICIGFLIFVNILQAAIPNQLKFDHSFNRLDIGQRSIRSIVQDKYGFIWLATSDGLYKLDGYDTKIFKHDPGDTNSISDNYIWDLYVDKDGIIWIGTGGGGLNRLDPSTETIEVYKNRADDSSSVSHNVITDIFEDHKGILWLSTDGGGINRFNKYTEQFNSYLHDPQDINSLATNSVNCIFEDSKHRIWIGTAGGLDRFDPETGKFFHFNHDPGNQNSLPHNIIGVIREDDHGKLWIGTGTELDQGNGLCYLDPETNLFKRINYFSKKGAPSDQIAILDFFIDENNLLWIGTESGLHVLETEKEKSQSFFREINNTESLTTNRILTIFKDRSGLMWFGTIHGGINTCNLGGNRFINYRYRQDDPNSLSDNIVRSIYQDHQGYIWVGTLPLLNDGGLNRINPLTGVIKHYKHDPLRPKTIPTNRIVSILEDSDNNLWLGTWGQGLIKFNTTTERYIQYLHDEADPKSLKDNYVQSIYEDNDGILWIGTENGGLFQFDKKNNKFKQYAHDPNNQNSLSHNSVQSNAIIEGDDNHLWVGTWDGLNKFNKQTGVFTQFKHVSGDSSSLSKNQVLCIFKDAIGDLWLATHGGGLNHFSLETGTFSQITVSNGLPSNTVYGVIGDQSGKLWITTDEGLACFDTSSGEIRVYDDSDGLQGDQFYWGACYSNNQGEIMVGGTNGLTVFNPDELKDNTYIPPIWITSFRVFEKDRKLKKSLTEIEKINLSYKDNFFGFEFAALNYLHPEKNQYAYRLKGFNEDWIYCGSRRYASYTNLNGGEYIFQVKASNNDGKWNETGTAIKIYITPPFYKTWWFITISSLLLLTGIIVGYRLRVRSIKKKNLMLEAQVEERTQEIKERNQDLIQAKRETDNILNNVNDGLFLLDREYNLGTQSSAALIDILGEQELTSKNFIQYLENKIPSPAVDQTKQFLELLVAGNIDEESLRTLNPLMEVEFKLKNSKEELIVKILRFDFKCIRNQIEDTEIIVTVNDITREVKLAKSLKETEERSQRKMDWMLKLLNVDPSMLNEFLQSANQEMKEVNATINILPSPLSSYEGLYRSVHTIKGNAALLDFPFIAQQAHEIEFYINKLQMSRSMNKNDYNRLKNELKKLIDLFEEINGLLNQIGKLHENFRPKRSYENEQFIKALSNLIKNLSTDYSKKVILDVSEFNGFLIPHKHQLALRDILVQLCRNAVYHGLETPEERKMLGKDEKGTIRLSNMESNGLLKISFEDDGKGLNMDKIIHKTLELNLTDENGIKKLSQEELSKFIFYPGFSTAENSDLHAGRGIGMDIIKKKVKDLGGEINIHFKPDKFCRFDLVLPLTM